MFSNETKIGLLVIISAALMIWGFKFIKGKNILSSSTILYVEYDEIDRLATSTPVTIQGFQVGIVADIYFKKKNDIQVVEVKLDIGSDIKVPKDASANIVATGFMGGKAIVLDFDRPCDGADCAQTGDYLNGNFKNVLSSMMSTEDLGGYMNEVKSNVGPIVDTLKSRFTSEGEGQQTMADVQEIITNLKSATGSIDKLMRNSSSKIDGLLANMESITGTINSSQTDIKGIISNANSFSAKMNALDLDKTMSKANTALDATPELMDKLKGTLAEADKAAQELTKMMQKMNSGEGSVGKLMNDDQLFTDIERVMQNLDLLLEDFRLHPERYRRILSKKKIPYEAPN